MDEETRRRESAAINRLLRGEATEYASPSGTRYRRFRRDGTEWWEQSYSDGATTLAEITPSLQALFERIAAMERAEDIDKLYREAGIPLPGDPAAPRPN